MKKNKTMRDGTGVPSSADPATASAVREDAQHTPGPWECHELSGGEIKVTRLAIDLATVDAMYRHPKTAKANARLIAAAPDLLAALKRFVDAEDRTIERFTSAEIDELEIALKEGRAAIAKAEGR